MRLAEAREEQQVAGVHRHAEVVDGPARLHHGGRHHVPPVDDGRRAGDEDDVAAAPVKLAHRVRHLGAAVSAADLGGKRPVEPGKPCGDGTCGRIEHALAHPRQPGLDQADRARLERRETQHRPALFRDLDAALDHGARRGEGDHLDRRHHLACLDQGVGRDGAESHGLVEKIEPVHPRIVDHGEAVRFGKDVAAAGEGIAEGEPRPADRACDGLGGLVLAHVLGLQTGAGDGRDLRFQQHLDILGREHAPLLEGAAGQAHAVSEDQSLRLCDRHVAEDHGPPVTIRRPRPARAAGGAPGSPRP